MLRNAASERSRRGPITKLSPIPPTWEHRVRVRLGDINNVCFGNLIAERYRAKKHLGKHVTDRAKKIFRMICEWTEEKNDSRFCRGKWILLSIPSISHSWDGFFRLTILYDIMHSELRVKWVWSKSQSCQLGLTWVVRIDSRDKFIITVFQLCNRENRISF